MYHQFLMPGEFIRNSVYVCVCVCVRGEGGEAGGGGGEWGGGRGEGKAKLEECDSAYIVLSDHRS